MGIPAWVKLAICSLAATWLFFLEYLPPFQVVGFHSDLAGYHYPLLNHAWQEIRQGRLPLWDPVMYCGISYTGITQEGLFYPPDWLLFMAAALTKGMLLKSVEVLLMLHLWAGFLFCFGWLRERTGSGLAAFAGAAAFAAGGMPMGQSQHLGVVCCYAWIPAALWCVERARRSDSGAPLLALAAVSAMAFLAGYPPAFLAFALCVACWAVAGSMPLRHTLLCAASLGFSMLLAAVQLLPALQANLSRMPERSYGGGLPEGAFTYFLLALPNFFDGARPEAGVAAWRDHFYLGGTAVLGLAAAGAGLVGRRWSGSRVAQPLATLCAALLLIENPFGLVARAEGLFPTLEGVLREYNLLPCVAVAACCLAAEGIARLEDCFRWNMPRWGAAAAMAASAAWSARLLWLWVPGGPELPSGWASVPDVLVAAALAGVLLAGAAHSRLSAAGLIVFTLVELKCFGTNRKFSAVAGHPDKRMRALRDARTGGHAMAGMEQGVFDRLRADSAHRVIVMDGIQPIELHYYGLASPQGFEVSLPDSYRRKVASYAEWKTNRLFEPDAANEAFLQAFGVKYAICRAGDEQDRRLSGMPHWHAMGSDGFFFRVFEYRGALTAYRWRGQAAVTEWLAGRRAFRVASSTGGDFALLEQGLPGWVALVDGREAPIETWEGVFQRVSVPAGEHRVEFLYRPRDVVAGAWLSAAAWAALIGLWVRSGRRGIEPAPAGR